MITIEPSFEAALATSTLTRFLNRARAAIRLKGEVDVLLARRRHSPPAQQELPWQEQTHRRPQLSRSVRNRQHDTPAISPSRSKPPRARPQPTATPCATKSASCSSTAFSTSPAKITRPTTVRWPPAKRLSAANSNSRQLSSSAPKKSQNQAARIRRKPSRRNRNPKNQARW